MDKEILDFESTSVSNYWRNHYPFFIILMIINDLIKELMPVHNISYPSSAAAVVFGVHLSARAAFRLDRKSPAIRTCV
jgi:hypothetical protein